MRSTEQMAERLLRQFKGDRYAFGSGALERLGPMTAELGDKALLVGRIQSEWLKPALASVRAGLGACGVKVLDQVVGARPNAPRQDVYRLRDHILDTKPDVVVSLESGSGIDACKAAAVLATFADRQVELDGLFGVGQVTKLREQTGRGVLPVVACMTAAGSAAHLTKYSNVTDAASGQKKLIVDEAIVPPRAVFDYSLTASQPTALTLDGGLDGVSHCLEVYLGAKGDAVGRVEEICLCGIELLLAGLGRLCGEAGDVEGRRQVALGTDLGGYAIMVGGTNGPHLNSFSLVKQLTHGRACALMNPYYTAFFAPAVPDRVRNVGRIYQKHGFVDAALEDLSPRELGLAVAGGMLAFNRSIGFPTSLRQVDGIDRAVLDKALRAAKDPSLASKLENMPVPLTAETVDRCMGGVLDAAWQGDLTRIEAP